MTILQATHLLKLQGELLPKLLLSQSHFGPLVKNSLYLLLLNLGAIFVCRNDSLCLSMALRLALQSIITNLPLVFFLGREPLSQHVIIGI